MIYSFDADITDSDDAREIAVEFIDLMSELEEEGFDPMIVVGGVLLAMQLYLDRAGEIVH